MNKMALNCSPEFKGVIVQLVEIRFESASALTNITLAMPMHLRQVHLRQVVLKNMIYIFSCVFLWFKPRTTWGRSILDPGATI